MDEASLLEQVGELRRAGRSPKEIARVLGLAPSTVAPLVRRLAADGPAPTSEERRHLVGCWASAGWATGLAVDGHPEWPGRPGPGGEDHPPGNLAAVVVARHGSRGGVSVCGYLVDPYCLGVKNALGPRRLGASELVSFLGVFFEAFDGRYLDVPLDLARHLVFGAVDYARSLGFEPHPDFGAAAGHLGRWRAPSAITFGDNGAPVYVEGPYDDARSVLATLDRTVGADNYRFVVQVL